MSTHKIKIIARLRPRIAGEVDDQGIQVTPDCKAITAPNPRDTTQVFKFPFSRCYGQNSTQEELFVNDVEPVLDLAFEGVTVTCFCYGVTSSGKTHTMQGTLAQPGVIPRTIHTLFSKQSSRYRNARLSISYFEIYKDEVYDLLVAKEKSYKLPVRENDAGQVFVANLSSTPIASEAEFHEIYSHATKQRSVGATNLNRESSRSHAILTIYVVLNDPVQNKTFSGKINLVDLAGSENNKMTGNDSTRMIESAAINKSLSVLGQVVHALNQGAPRIPYRNSKLTRILQDALGGSSVGILICNLAPGTKFRQDTLNTLNFAVRTKNVENKPVINERDNKPVPKPHFAAVQQAPPSLPPAVIPSLEAKPVPVTQPQPIVQPRPSKVPRPSGIGIWGGPRPSTALPTPFFRSSSFSEDSTNTSASSVNEGGLTAEEIDQRIAKAVAAEVARRMAEIEKAEEARKREWEERRRELEESSSMRRRRTRSLSPPRLELKSLPPGIVTPLLKRHARQGEATDLHMELRNLEESLDNNAGDRAPEEVLSPGSRKKTGRAYVALARAHSQKGDLIQALTLYKKALQFVPDNKKLQDRIVDIEYAIKEGRPFFCSPMKVSNKPRRSRSVPSNRIPLVTRDEEVDEVDEVERHLPGFMPESPIKGHRSTFTQEFTNGKRAAGNDENLEPETPPKKQKRLGTNYTIAEESSEDEDRMFISPVKRGRRPVVH